MILFHNLWSLWMTCWSHYFPGELPPPPVLTRSESRCFLRLPCYFWSYDVALFVQNSVFLQSFFIIGVKCFYRMFFHFKLLHVLCCFKVLKVYFMQICSSFFQFSIELPLNPPKSCPKLFVCKSISFDYVKQSGSRQKLHKIVLRYMKSKIEEYEVSYQQHSYSINIQYVSTIQNLSIDYACQKTLLAFY